MATKEISRKITISTIAGKATAWFEKVMKHKDEKGNALPFKLCRLYGAASGFTLGATEFGEFCKFRGTFRAINLVTGETQDAPQIILPDHLAEMLKSAIERAEGGAVQFAFEISAIFDASVATKYRYIAESNLPPVQNDPLAQLEAQMKEAGFALPAPAQKSLPGTEAADEAADEAAAEAPAEASAKGKKSK